MSVNCSKKKLSIGKQTFDCAIGVNGSIPEAEGREGDGKTPLGTYLLRYGFYRADRIEEPDTQLVMHEICEDDGWCDAPEDAAYNRLVRLPYPASAEEMFRDSTVYDVVLVLGHNDTPPVAGRGSAIFLHVAREGYKPTQGCVAVSLDDMMKIVPDLPRGAIIEIGK
ncbi:MAG: hypothetical protein EX271_00015 [Acidimicrobiales bacterium]|nr:L,D-transpeptidase family protein [Hyphomonadaceae bacterium]RZV45114.1 MAG: hypothetical protein EX271_00015 [Acidimicrobiales bacterium]